MKIYRSIIAPNFQAIDLENIGRHWTACPVVASNYGTTFNGSGNVGEGMLFIFCAEVNAEDMDLDACVESMQSHPSEKEVVLLSDRSLLAVLDETTPIFDETWDISRWEGKINTGTRADAWVDDGQYFPLPEKHEQYLIWIQS